MLYIAMMSAYMYAACVTSIRYSISLPESCNALVTLALKPVTAVTSIAVASRKSAIPI